MSERAEHRIDLLKRLLGAVHYQALRHDHQADWTALADRLREIDARDGTAGARVVYLATPPQAYSQILAHLHHCGLAGKDGRPTTTRIAIENPSAPTGPPRRS